MRYPMWDDRFTYPVEGPSIIHNSFKDLPFSVKKEFGEVLDLMCKWRMLLERMNFVMEEIKRAEEQKKVGSTPGIFTIQQLCLTDRTVTDVFVYLDRIKFRKGMLLLQDYVPEKYQILLEDDEKDFKLFLTKISLHLEYDYCKNYGVEDGAEERGAVPPLDICDYMYCIDDSVTKCYDDIQKLTQRFKPSTIVYKGSFNILYKAVADRNRVIVKRYQFNELGHFELNTHQLEIALKDVKYMQMYQHPNIMLLSYFGFRGNEMCLVYNSNLLHYSLDYYIRGICPIHVAMIASKKLPISRGIAEGLAFLHTSHDRPLIHMNIRPENIFLDHRLRPKITNFGFSREGPSAKDPPVASDQQYERSGYFPPEYTAWPHYISTKLDVYAFGMLMIQLTAFREKGDPDSVYIRHFIHAQIDQDGDIQDIIDLRDWVDRNTLRVYNRILHVAYYCTKEDYIVRPEMKTVLEHLDRINH
ncbi:hypothetical protein DMENIID0001_040040 [Sergentomyia squamirostris]